MTPVLWIRVLVFGYLSWQSSNASVQSPLGFCFYGHMPLYWWEAREVCSEKGTDLICYSSKEELQAIVDRFIVVPSQSSISIWLSKRKCSPITKPEECLSLIIGKTGNVTWRFIQKLCDQRFTFICCSEENGNQSMTSSTVFIQSTTLGTTSTQVVSTQSDESITTESHPATNATEESLLHCDSIYKNGVKWPKTPPGQDVFMPCPGNSIGNLTWSCNWTGVWVPDNPDPSQCQSTEILNIKEKFNSTSAHTTIDALEKVTYDDEDFHKKDLFSVVSMMSLLPDRLFGEVTSLPEEQRWEMMQNSFSKSVSIFDSVISLKNIWTAVNEEKRLNMGSDILSTVDSFGIFLADIMAAKDEFTFLKNNIAIKVQKFPLESQVPQLSWTNFRNGSKDSIALDEGYERNFDSNRGDLSVVFTHYSNMNLIISSSQPGKAASEGDGTLNSGVVSAMLSQQKIPVIVGSNVRITVDHLTSKPNDSACVFWDLKRNKWDTTGCALERSEDSYSVCVCDHLTNFAVLMDFRNRIQDVDSLPFFYITVIGCSISIVCLFLCVIVFTCYSCYSRNVWGLRYTIHRNLCLTLLVANVILIAGLNKTQNQVMCAVVAGLLHYFFLSAFCWMLLEGFHIYLMLVVVFASKRSHWEKYYIFGYGLPLVVVAATAISRPDGYGSDKVCWLSAEKGVIWSFTGPVACILAVNLCALILAHWKASKISTKENSSVVIIKRWLRVTVILFPILGITWLFGFLYFGKHFKVVAYIFTVLNSLQGFCIFICHCVLDTKARSMVLDSLKKKQASVATEVSGTHKKSKNRGTSKSLMNKLPEQKDESDTELCDRPRPRHGLSNVLKDRWSTWQKPWAFNFRLPVSERTENGRDEEHRKDTPEAIVFQWNRESASRPL